MTSRSLLSNRFRPVRRNSQGRPAKSPVQRRRWFEIEFLEDRLTPASFLEIGAALNLDLNVANESVQIASVGSSYALTLNSGNFWSGTDGVDVTGNGTDTLTVTSAGLASLSLVNLTDSSTGTAVSFANSAPFSYAQSFNVTLDNSPGAVTFDGSSQFGANNLTVATARNIVVKAGAAIVTSAGNIGLSANQQSVATSGDFVGIDIAGSVLTTDIGALTIQGKGGTGSGGSQIGVLVRNGGQVIGASGNVVVSGAGGSTFGNFNHGVSVAGPGSVIASGAGSLSVTGLAGILTGITTNDYGVFVSNGGLITSFGTGSVTVTGSAGNVSNNGTVNDYGVYVTGPASFITSSGGNVVVTGTGGGSSSGSTNSVGVYLANNGQISSGGNGDVTVTGTGSESGSTQNSARGVALEGASRITSGGSGIVSVTGKGSPNGALSFNCYGVSVAGSSRISSGGAGSVIVKAESGRASQYSAAGSYGLYLTGSGSTITSGGGDVEITGTGAFGSQSSNQCYGVFVDALAQIDSGGGDVRVNGNGGTSSTSGTGNVDYGVFVNAASRITSTGAGMVTVTGIGGGSQLNDTSGIGVVVAAGSQISSGGPGAVTVTGTAGFGSFNEQGVSLSGAASSITSGGGNVSVTGNSQGMASGNIGVLVDSATRITSGGAGTVTVSGTVGVAPSGANNHAVHVLGQISSGGIGSVTVSGTSAGGGGALNCNGIEVTGSITSGGGDVTLTGTGGAYGTGVEVTGIVTAGGLGLVTVTGFGGFPRGSSNPPAVNGVNVTAPGIITSNSGSVSVTGTGGQASTVQSYGVYVSGTITAGGNGSVEITGTSGKIAFSSDKFGVLVSGGVITTNGAGSVTVTGSPGTNTATTHDSGVGLLNGGRITSGGLGSVTVTGTGGTGFSDISGVIVSGSGSLISSGGGDVLVTGHGGSGGSRADGVFVGNSGRITSGGDGSLTIIGTGGTTVTASFLDASGVRLTDPGSQIDLGGAGLVTVTGTFSPSVPAGNAALVVKNSAQVLGGPGGDVVLTLDTVAIDGTSGISAGPTQSVTIQNRTAGLPIELGSAGVFGANPALRLPDVLLDRVSGGRLIIGRSDALATGVLVVSSDITRASASNLTLVSTPGISTTSSGPIIDLSGGTLTFGAGSALAVQINSDTLNTGYQQLHVLGSVDLAGLNLALAGSFFPVVDATLTLVNATTRLGQFNSLADGGSVIFNGREYVAGYDASTMTLTFTNHAPVAQDDSAATTDQASVLISPLSNDHDPDLGDAITIVSVATPSVGSVQFTANSITYTPVVNSSGPITFGYTIRDMGGLTATANVTVMVTDITAPKVVDLRVLYGSQSYSILNLTRTLPWFNIKKVEVDFSEPIVMGSSAVSLTGKTVASYNPALAVSGNRALLSLPTAIDVDRLMLTLDGLSSGGVHDLSGNAMGANFTKGFNVLPGDFNGDGVVTTTDLVGVGGLIGTAPSGQALFADLDGDGVITLADYNLVKSRIGRKLPTP